MLGRTNDVKHKFIKKWRSIQELRRFVERTDDVSLINKIRVVK